ncbi:MAG: DUF4097 family beta strand repeat protein [Streptosporangiales bacterium]|nr:DUF4097 family beta strand repeat protein [Streptosporangiales bacterium]
MPRFDTPEPIKVRLDTASGHVRIRTSERADTVVEVTPSDPSRKGDVQAAEETRVDFTSGELLVRTPKRVVRSMFGRTPSIDVRVEAPSGSRLDVEGWGDYRCEGPIGDSEFHVGAGTIRIEQATRLKLRTGAGDVAVERADGDVEMTTAAGRIKLGAVSGAATLKSSSGDITVGEVAGELRMRTAMGDVTVDSAMAGVQAKTAYGNVRVGEVVRGSVTLDTAFGTVEIGVREGTAAWLDVSSSQGSVRTDLEGAPAPDAAEETVEVRARTGFGDIIVRRA